ncbi:hypothetical protein JCM19240_5121 [Vibrio maritimus]|uniref:Uncharacterized protein n=1 Tax=Vibrio maritimus TaxID=990268 RepID=A0A090SVA2_9VIBR|nr:hypothetical protein JCM19240_5121 [Vibrio maritimus]
MFSEPDIKNISEFGRPLWVAPQIKLRDIRGQLCIRNVCFEL